MALSPGRSFPHCRAVSKPLSRLLLRSKDLDFLILTGCSCLITLLHHPTINHLQTAHGNSSNIRGSSPATPRHSPSPQTSRNNLGTYSAIVPKRQSFTIEDEES